MPPSSKLFLRSHWSTQSEKKKRNIKIWMRELAGNWYRTWAIVSLRMPAAWAARVPVQQGRGAGAQWG